MCISNVCMYMYIYIYIYIWTSSATAIRIASTFHLFCMFYCFVCSIVCRFSHGAGLGVDRRGLRRDRKETN